MLIEDGMGFPHGALTMTKVSILQYSSRPRRSDQPANVTTQPVT
jgi:hypothetical protein